MKTKQVEPSLIPTSRDEGGAMMESSRPTFDESGMPYNQFTHIASQNDPSLTYLGVSTLNKYSNKGSPLSIIVAKPYSLYQNYVSMHHNIFIPR
jgi:hypothetical protein